MRRVVITGLGAVSPLGSTVEKMWNGMTEGRCAIDKVTRFDTSPSRYIWLPRCGISIP